MDPKISFIPDKTEIIEPEYFKIIFNSLKLTKTITFEYRPLHKTTYMERSVDPYHVVCQRGNWYVIGKCHDKNDVRIFSFSRMKNIKISDQKFSIPKDFNPADYFDVEMGIWLSDKTPFDVELLIDKEIGTYALNRVWYSEQIVEEKEDGSVYVKFQTTRKTELIRWMLGQGHTVKVLAPDDLVEDIKKRIGKD